MKIHPIPLFLASIAIASLAGCASSTIKNEAPGPSAQATGLAAEASRITDRSILADRKTIDSLQLRLRKLNEAGIPQNNYPLAKAQCWLDSAKTQYNENDRTGYIEESLTESANIIGALEADKASNAGFATPLVARSTRLRDDLWAQLGGYKTQTITLACNARTVACAEVRLVRAGHAEQQTGWRAATPHIQMVEDGLRTASVEAANCPASAPVVARAAPAPAAPAPVIVAATPPAVVAPVAQTISKETFIILGDALFKFDKSGREDLLPGGLQRLYAVTERLKSYQSIQTLTIVGHTDRIGTDAYNDALSEKRANTVQSYFESNGIKAVKMAALGKGKREPVTTNCTDNQPNERLIECLQADRRVTVEVTGVVK